MIKEVLMPKLGETMEEGILSKWLKREGERVAKGEPLFEVVTDKATFESESAVEGFLRKIVVQADPEKNIPVLKVIAYVADSMDEKIPKEEKEIIREEKAEAHRLVEVKKEFIREEDDLRVKISPLARKLAKEKGIDISGIKGTGPGGRIVEKDIISAGAVPAGISQTDFTTVALSAIRRTIADRLSRSKHDIPHYYLQMEINMSEVVGLRGKLMEEIRKKGGPRISYNDIIIHAVGKALGEYPEINSNFIKGELKVFKDADIGIAVALQQGLVVPVIRQVNKKNIEDIACETKKIQEKAENNKFSPDDFAGGTFTISNLGMFDVDVFCAIINPPQVGILAVGKIGKGVVIEDDKLKPGYLMKVSLSLDHRVIDGAYGAKFLKRLKEILEKPYPGLIDRRTKQK